MKRVREMHEEWMKDPEYRKAHEALEEEFILADAIIAARVHAGLTQEELAVKMGTTQPAVARLESGRLNPSYRTLRSLAKATNTSFSIHPPTRKHTAA